jgi:DNA-binding beta-propeller fold protein YncE
LAGAKRDDGGDKTDGNLMKKIVALVFACGVAQAATLFISAYPNAILVFDEAKGQVVDTITLSTGLPTGMRMSQDRKTIYVATNDHAGIEVIDVATRKVTNHFVLDTPTKRYRFFSATPDPENKVLYTVTTEITKEVDRYEIAKPKYTVISLADGKILKTFDLPREDEMNGNARFGGLEVSPDGKYIYQFGQTINILNAEDFKVVDKIDLQKPDLPGMDTLGVGGVFDSLSTPGQRMSLFNSTDPIVHSRLFGIARFDFSTRQFEFTPIGPPPNGMSGLQVTPDKKNAYTVISSGSGGNKRCEFWAFDLASTKISHTMEVPCRSRFSFGMSGDGKKLYIYGAGFEIEVYDAVTLKYEKTWDLNHDVTGSLIVLP